jgi:hypothetical protein
MLVKEYANQHRKEQSNAMGGVNESSPRHEPLDRSANISSYCPLRHSPMYDQLLFQQDKPPNSISRPVAMESIQETGNRTAGGFKIFVNEVVGLEQPKSGELVQGSLQQSNSTSPFDGLIFVRPNVTGRRWSMGSDPFFVPILRGATSSDRTDPIPGDQCHQCCTSVDSPCVPSPQTTSEQTSLVSVLTNKWARTIRGPRDANEKTEVENASIQMSRPPLPQRRSSEPSSSSSSIADAAHARQRTNIVPAIDSSQWPIPKSEGRLLVDFPKTERTRGGSIISPTKLLVDFPTPMGTRSQDNRKDGTKMVKQTGNKIWAEARRG